MTTTDRTPPRPQGPAAPRSRARRRVAGGAGLLLVAALLPLLGATPAQAAECTSEVAPTMEPLPIPTGPGCDDPEPPETTLESTTPQPTGAGWIRQDQVAFTFSGAYTDADTDPIGFECQLYVGTAAPADWTPCTSPASYDNLEETPASSYTFKVRAVDTADDGIDLTADPLFPQDTDTPDFDQTPAEATFRVDTEAPLVSVHGGPYDRVGDGWPVATKPRVTYILSANEEVDYTCQLDGRTVACAEGETMLKGLEGGSRTFSVAAKDRAGNSSGSSVVKQFVMPYNLTSSQDWNKARLKGAFAGDVLQTKKPGDRVKFRARNVRALTLLAPSGPNLGKIQVRVGNGVWHVVDLSRKKASPRRSYVIRTASAPLVSGSVLIESISTRLVQVDALVLPPG